MKSILRNSRNAWRKWQKRDNTPIAHVSREIASQIPWAVFISSPCLTRRSAYSIRGIRVRCGNDVCDRAAANLVSYRGRHRCAFLGADPAVARIFVGPCLTFKKPVAQ
jgi:hypothetical protein